MTEAEKLADKLNEAHAKGHVASAGILSVRAASLLRELDAQNKRMAEALRDCPTGYDDDGNRYDHGGFYSEWRSRHADALRDAGIAP